MDITQIIERLRKPRRAGPNRYMACCPAHPDKTPSLSISEASNGTILMYCFSGCTVEAICDAIAISQTDLFPPRPDETTYRSQPRPLLTATDALRGLRSEVGIIALAACDILDGKKHTSDDVERILNACQRIITCAEFVNEQVR